MNDDEVGRRLAETLHAEASRVTSPPEAWEHFSEGNVAATMPASHRRLWLWMPAGILAAAAALTVVLVLRPAHHGSATQVSGSPAPSISAAQQPTAVTAPTGGPVPVGFVPASVTFTSPSNGWVLGTAPCASPPCTSIIRTTDGGRTWRGIPAPATPLNAAPGQGNTGVSRLRFASRLDGWAFGPQLWSTHDGGATWQLDVLPGVASTALVEDVEAFGDVVYAAVTGDGGRVQLFTNSVGATSWPASTMSVDLGAGPVPSGQLVLHAPAGWFVQVDRTVVSGARLSSHWQAWSPPCAAAGGPAFLAASSSLDLAAVCEVGVWTGATRATRLMVSRDGGDTFADVATVGATGVDSVATPVRGHVVVGAGPSLLLTTDDGATWRPVVTRPDVYGWSDLGFTTPTQGVVVAVGSAQLLMTHDGGSTWRPVAFR